MKNVERVMLIGTAFLVPFSASALTAPVAPTDQHVPTDLAPAITKVITWILGLVALIAVLMIVWGGVQYLTAAGDQDRTRSAKDTITHAIMGLAIAGLAYAIITTIVTALSVA